MIHIVHILFTAGNFINSAAAARVCSVKVEKKHLLGQELKKKQTRGKAPAPKTLHQRTYQHLIVRTAKRQQDAIKSAAAATKFSRSLLLRSAHNSLVVNLGRKRGFHGAKLKKVEKLKYSKQSKRKVMIHC